MLTVFFVVLGLVTGAVLGRVGLRVVRDIQNCWHGPTPKHNRWMEEIFLFYCERHPLASPFIGAAVCVIWSCVACQSGAHGWALFWALFGGLTVPLSLLAMVLGVRAVYLIVGYSRTMLGWVDLLYEGIKYHLRRPNQKSCEGCIRYLALVVSKRINSKEADDFLKQSAGDKELHCMVVEMMKVAAQTRAASDNTTDGRDLSSSEDSVHP